MQNLTLILRPQTSYQAIVDSIVAANGEWVEVRPGTISGKANSTKQGRLNQAGRGRGIRIQTTFQPDGRLYARLRPVSA